MIAHISLAKRSEGHLGGVPKFAWYLGRAIGNDFREYSWSGCPLSPEAKRVSEPQAAQLLGEWLWDSGRLADCSKIVVDGFWSRGLPDKAPVVVVAHGTWRGLGNALHSQAASQLGDIQEREYKRFPVVAVSEGAAQDLADFYGVKATAVIENGVDLDEFRPRENRILTDPLIAIYSSIHFPKGGDIIEGLAKWGGLPVRFEYLDAKAGEEAVKFRRGDLFVYPSRYDGNAYALLEAMASGLTVVASRTGLMRSAVSPRPGVVVDGFDTQTWIEAVRPVALQLIVEEHNPGCMGTDFRSATETTYFHPRECAETRGDFRRFAEQWRAFLAS